MATDARRKEVYWARYVLEEGQLPQLIDGPHVGFASDLPHLPVFGAGAGLYADVLRADEDFAETQPDAASLGGGACSVDRRAGALGFHTLVPARIGRTGTGSREACPVMKGER